MAIKMSEPAPINEILIWGNGALDEMISEDIINIELSVIEPSEGDQSILDCDNCLRFLDGNSNATVKLKHEIIKIDPRAFISLYQDAISMRTDEENYMTGLKIWFGCSEKEIVPLFEPVLIQKNPNEVDVYWFNEKDNFKIKVYNESASPARFEEYEPTHGMVNTCLKEYTDKIRINHFDEDPGIYSSHRKETDSRAIIFPFQTIFSLIVHNQMSRVVKLSSSIRKEDDDGNETIQHSILLSTTSPNKGLLTDKYANRSHLCPPKCRGGRIVTD